QPLRADGRGTPGATRPPPPAGTSRAIGNPSCGQEMVAVPHPPEALLTPEDEELGRKKARLAELEAQLADRELERASLLADLAHFEKLYLRSVGRRYAVLDDLKAKIAEARARQNPHRPDAREQARQARQ